MKKKLIATLTATAILGSMGTTSVFAKGNDNGHHNGGNHKAPSVDISNPDYIQGVSVTPHPDHVTPIYNLTFEDKLHNAIMGTQIPSFTKKAIKDVRFSASEKMLYVDFDTNDFNYTYAVNDVNVAEALNKLLRSKGFIVSKSVGASNDGYTMGLEVMSNAGEALTKKALNSYYGLKEQRIGVTSVEYNPMVTTGGYGYGQVTIRFTGDDYNSVMSTIDGQIIKEIEAHFGIADTPNFQGHWHLTSTQYGYRVYQQKDY